ncbi:MULTISPECIES: GNAT family N-acetyltransferase [Nostoc]|uniref:GNAT family N-acetyltransferase n=1 Tax=Nostoc TaxID=1177 RepID=UPI000DED2128|nr:MULTISPECIES: GNAT family N-acetyltransferase [unclassified Nostoc]MBD2506145.1 GNAT family N-acetyltransferase [Desmonostoc muscorum FACHB-395]QHG18025.1 GNAT family N-acetyltransferase [Nostoc sp. ATCC 53789]QLE50793.1 GNAT family N-acetyltransferase [Nostoc sp. C057]RCJ29695.1 acetyltransferase [Nostoc sp. ATCC 53789]
MSTFDETEAIYVRELGIDDIAPVYHLGEGLFTSDLYPYLYRTWDEWEVIGLYNTDPEYCLVAETDGELAGFILGTIITKASWTYGYILWLGVSPKYQRRGVADKLVDKVVARMIEDGARFMLVDTDPTNTSALKFFNRKGFGNTRQHIFLSMNLSKHEYYGRLIDYEHQKAERAGYKRSRPAIRARKADSVANEVVLNPLAGESQTTEDQSPI